MDADEQRFQRAMVMQSPTMVIAGKVYQRIAHGDGAAKAQTCGSCGVPLGRLHLQPCTWEDCPRCGAPVIECGCTQAREAWQ